MAPPQNSLGLASRLAQAGVRVIRIGFPQTEHAFDLGISPATSPAAQASLYHLERFLALMSAGGAVSAR